ncbi:ribonuclease R [Bariatricus massiliensis]|uniref:Ribonuclease R n=1 Tax=Bariatricus massiliensis TaxID=1745713 RepID=A0ABS8DDC6_9FIRM|nr:ribonuclease R [Bariatricus massiliensis]MCB7302528.1 ribonuclease R [Bariatricus massiliensis]MCB7373744.1 ribonuclease R [Bariatricus massiliensis]MCB7386414.1 ribonuclease R [Bariatricus massiliensis]MCB7410576.1 ribonuclease R [Bariatricus massiliensis]MCQ5253587.1 ribonuclease R [Bariatricus massiliensis]
MDQMFEKRKKLIYDFMCDEFYVPMKLKELAVLLQVPKEQREELKAVMDSLEREGKIHVTQKGKYIKGEARHLRGTFQAHAKGFGFVIIEGEPDDIFISEDDMNGAMQGDEVEVVVTAAPQGKRREGKILRIVNRGTATLVGYYQSRKNFGFVVPDNARYLQDIFVPAEKSKGAVTGHKVVVELTSYGGEGKKPEGRIVEILGHANDPGVDILSIVKGFGLPTEFPEKVLNQAERLAKPVSSADMAGRKDIRGWQTVTIDGEDAKDLDDAITLTKEGNKYVLGVHIADVTNYVQENSALDREALKRGTSVYLADRVIPMLPHALSNGMCSLNAGEERLALSCIMKIDNKGDVVDHLIAETIVKVDERMSYTSVKKILEDHDEAECERYRDLIPMFEHMQELSAILREKRHKRGAIDFDFPEAKLKLDENGNPLEITPYDRNVATKIIEDFMLLANETVAEDYFWQEIPFVYRVHEAPDEEKMKKLQTFIQNFGYTMHLSNQVVRPKEIQKLLDKIEGTQEEAMICRLTLRSMKQAKYSPDNEGHFGLATQYYTHFTSPIRRYPDLQIHRIIKDNLRGRMNEGRRNHFDKILPEVTMQASSLERRAEEAERETIKLKKVQYMQQFFGKEFEGVISGITKWGMYVELPNTVEGLVHVTVMTDDHYDYDEEHYRMIGSHTRKVYELGQKLRVRVIGTDILTRTIDFEIAGEES